VPQDYGKPRAGTESPPTRATAGRNFASVWPASEGGSTTRSVEAARWYRKAADQGGVEAQGLLGFAYANGMGVPQDYGEAARWYRRAADQGNTTAQSFSARRAPKGGVPQDYPRLSAGGRGRLTTATSRRSSTSASPTPRGRSATGLCRGILLANLASALNKDAKKEAIPKLRDSIGAALPREQLSATQKRCRQWMDDFEKRKAQK